MLTFMIMLLDTVTILLLFLFLLRLLRAVWMRAIFMHRIKLVCQTQNLELTVHRCPFLSVLFKSSKIDLTVRTEREAYHVKLFASLSSKRVLHFVDENNYVSYVKTFTALPMATKISEHTNFAVFHRFPPIERKQEEEREAVYVLLFNPTPNNIVSACEGTLIEVGNGSRIGSLWAYNGKGFCAMLDQSSNFE